MVNVEKSLGGTLRFLGFFVSFLLLPLSGLAGPGSEELSRAIEMATRLRQRIEATAGYARLFQGDSRWLGPLEALMLRNPEAVINTHRDIHSVERIQRRFTLFEARVRDAESLDQVIRLSRGSRSTSGRLSTFSSKPEISARSWGSQFPALLKQIQERQLSADTFEKQVMNKTTRAALHELLALRKSRASHLRFMAGQIEGNTSLRDALLSAAERIEVTPATEARLRASANRWPPLPLEDDSRFGSQLDFLRSVASSVRGEMANLDLAMRLDDVVSYATRARDLPGFSRVPIDVSLCNKEIDLVFKGGMAWAEVKNMSVGGQEKNSREIIDQALQTLALRNHIDTRIELHIFFYAGVLPSIAEDLEAIGFTVHGIRLGG